MSVSQVRLAVHYKGDFLQDKKCNFTKYVGGIVVYIVVDKDRCCWIDLSDEIASLTKISKENLFMYYQIMGRSLSEAMGTLSSDQELMSMFSDNENELEIDVFILESVTLESDAKDGVKGVVTQEATMVDVDIEMENKDNDDIDSVLSLNVECDEPLCEEVPKVKPNDAREVNLEDIQKHQDAIGRELSDYEPNSSYASLKTQSDSSDAGDHHSNESIEDIDMDIPMFHVGLCFSNVNVFRHVLRLYAIRGGCNLNYLKSDRKRVTATCCDKNCSWRVHASVLRDGHTFKIKTLKNEHSCQHIDASISHMASSNWLALKILGKLKDEPGVKTCTLVNELFREYGIKVPYLRMWRAKAKALEEIHGKYKDSYNFLPSFKAHPRRSSRLKGKSCR